MQGHRVKYDDGTCEHEDLTHRAYKLPGLAGDTVFNPDADVQSPLVAHTPPTPGAKSGMALVGQRIQVWWAQDEEFYPGVIKSYKKVQLTIRRFWCCQLLHKMTVDGRLFIPVACSLAVMLLPTDAGVVKFYRRQQSLAGCSFQLHAGDLFCSFLVMLLPAAGPWWRAVFAACMAVVSSGLWGVCSHSHYIVCRSRLSSIVDAACLAAVVAHHRASHLAVSPPPWMLLRAFRMTYKTLPRHCIYGTRPFSIHP